MSRRPRVRPLSGLALAAVLALPVLLAACGGGKGGSGPTQPPPVQPGIVFTPLGTPGVNALSLASGTGTTTTTLVLELRATQMTDLYGVAFNLTYPSAQLQFTRATAGALLGSGAVQASVSSPGTLIVGGTHLGNVPGANGSGVVMTLEFSATAAGSGSFAFARNSALNSSGQPIAGVTWLGGTATVTE
jgi:hypothetical protein